MAFDSNNPALRDSETRKGDFREEARDIVWKDRASRKGGSAVDTGGAIARAMERAYKLGLAHGGARQIDVPTTNADPDAPIPWNSIPPKPRGIIERIWEYRYIVLLVPNAAPWTRSPDKWVCYREAGKKEDGTKQFEMADSFSRSTLAPIVRLGLMTERVRDGKTYLATTPKGAATWRAAIASGQASEST